MARYTPEFLAALRHRYEQTHQSKRSIAREFGLAGSTILRIAAKEEWLRPPEPMREIQIHQGYRVKAAHSLTRCATDKDPRIA